MSSFSFSLFIQSYLWPFCTYVLLLSPQVAVRLPDNTTVDGFLGLYDDEIAIVTSVGVLAVVPVSMNLRKSRGGSALAAARAFNLCNLMGVNGYLNKHDGGLYTFVSDSHVLTEVCCYHFFFLVGNLA